MKLRFSKYIKSFHCLITKKIHAASGHILTCQIITDIVYNGIEKTHSLIFYHQKNLYQTVTDKWQGVAGKIEG